MQHDPHGDDGAQPRSYEPPRITDIGSLADLTLAFNKRGPRPDVFSNIAPIVGSLVPIR